MLILASTIGPYLGPYALVGHTLVNGSATTPAIDTTNGKLAVVAGFNNVPVTFADNQGSAFTPLTPIGDLYSAYCVDLQGTGSGHTFSMSSSNYPSICVSVWSYTGVAPALDQAGELSQIGGTIAPGVINPTSDGQLLVTMVTRGGFDATSVLTISSRFTITDQHPWAGTGGGFLGMAYLLQPKARRANPRWRFSSGATGFASMATIASFR